VTNVAVAQIPGIAESTSASVVMSGAIRDSRSDTDPGRDICDRDGMFSSHQRLE